MPTNTKTKRTTSKSGPSTDKRGKGHQTIRRNSKKEASADAIIADSIASLNVGMKIGIEVYTNLKIYDTDRVDPKKLYQDLYDAYVNYLWLTKRERMKVCFVKHVGLSIPSALNAVVTNFKRLVPDNVSLHAEFDMYNNRFCFVVYKALDFRAKHHAFEVKTLYYDLLRLNKSYADCFILFIRALNFYCGIETWYQSSNMDYADQFLGENIDNMDDSDNDDELKEELMRDFASYSYGEAYNVECLIKASKVLTPDKLKKLVFSINSRHPIFKVMKDFIHLISAGFNIHDFVYIPKDMSGYEQDDYNMGLLFQYQCSILWDLNDHKTAELEHLLDAEAQEGIHDPIIHFYVHKKSKLTHDDVFTDAGNWIADLQEMNLAYNTVVDDVSSKNERKKLKNVR